jgi:hypothetical protein
MILSTEAMTVVLVPRLSSSEVGMLLSLPCMVDALAVSTALRSVWLPLD